MSKNKKTNIKDIFHGKLLEIWEDGEYVYISLGFTVAVLTLADWEQLIKEDLEKFIKEQKTKKVVK